MNPMVESIMEEMRALLAAEPKPGTVEHIAWWAKMEDLEERVQAAREMVLQSLEGHRLQ